VANRTVARVLLSERFALSLALFMVACVGISLHYDRPPTEIERVIPEGAIAIAGGWFLFSGWSMWCARDAKPRDTPLVRLSRVQFKVRSLMIAVAVVAGLVAVALSPIGLFVALGLLYVSLFGVWWWVFRGFRRLSGLCFGVVGASVNTLSAAVCVYLLNTRVFVLMFIGWFSAFPIVMGAGVAWASAATRRTASPRRCPLLAWPLVLVLALLPLSMLFTFWPFRLAFLASRPAMDRMADRVDAGQAVTSPEWVGLFRVVGSAVDPFNGNVGLIIDPDPSGRSGFVRFGRSSNMPQGRRQRGPFYNLYADLDLHDGWRDQTED
jgi:hypothetical protein